MPGAGCRATSRVPAVPVLADTSALEIPPAPAIDPAADRDVLADAWCLTPQTPAPAPDPDEAVVGLREAYEKHLSDIVAGLKASRWARGNARDFPGPVDKRGAESP